MDGNTDHTPCPCATPSAGNLPGGRGRMNVRAESSQESVNHDCDCYTGLVRNHLFRHLRPAFHRMAAIYFSTSSDDRGNCKEMAMDANFRLSPENVANNIAGWSMITGKGMTSVRYGLRTTPQKFPD
ncbi:hypothetical protein Bbelb_047040 [Branchiostoma belcheri]|nr:hypothetical protein Bbelb_047040 [Branchiostoma belcheri]